MQPIVTTFSSGNFNDNIEGISATPSPSSVTHQVCERPVLEVAKRSVHSPMSATFDPTFTFRARRAARETCAIDILVYLSDVRRRVHKNDVVYAMDIVEKAERRLARNDPLIGETIRIKKQGPVILLRAEKGVLKKMGRGEGGWRFGDIRRRYGEELYTIIRHNLPAVGESFSLELSGDDTFSIIDIEGKRSMFNTEWLKKEPLQPGAEELAEDVLLSDTSHSDESSESESLKIDS